VSVTGIFDLVELDNEFPSFLGELVIVFSDEIGELHIMLSFFNDELLLMASNYYVHIFLQKISLKFYPFLV
jgi:hypothetical protein